MRLAAMLTARVATAAAGMIMVVKAAMALILVAASKPAAAVLAGGESGEEVDLYEWRCAREEIRGKKNNQRLNRPCFPQSGTIPPPSFK
jgi:hypothetical protein